MAKKSKQDYRDDIEGYRDARKEMSGEADFVMLIRVLGIAGAFYLVWPLEGWVEGIAALLGGAIGGSIIGRFILMTPGGKFVIGAISAAIKLLILVVIAATLFYFIQNN
ncbi:MAG: hypothetical protein AAF559_05820 [Pseudomonadota bacterium]